MWHSSCTMTYSIEESCRRGRRTSSALSTKLRPHRSKPATENLGGFHAARFGPRSHHRNAGEVRRPAVAGRNALADGDGGVRDSAPVRVSMDRTRDGDPHRADQGRALVQDVASVPDFFEIAVLRALLSKETVLLRIPSCRVRDALDAAWAFRQFPLRGEYLFEALHLFARP